MKNANASLRYTFSAAVVAILAAACGGRDVSLGTAKSSDSCGNGSNNVCLSTVGCIDDADCASLGTTCDPCASLCLCGGGTEKPDAGPDANPPGTEPPDASTDPDANAECPDGEVAGICLSTVACKADSDCAELGSTCDPCAQVCGCGVPVGDDGGADADADPDADAAPDANCSGESNGACLSTTPCLLDTDCASLGSVCDPCANLCLCATIDAG
jgi:hypothetical protein